MNRFNLDFRLLEHNDLFSGLSAQALDRFIARMTHEVFEPGQTIIREGETGNRLYLIQDGCCDVFKRVITRDEIGVQRIAILKAGETFGEMELVDRQPRSATVKASEGVGAEVLSVSTIDLYHWGTEDYRTFSIMLLNISREISLRLRNTDLWLAGSLFSIRNRPPDSV